MLLKCTEIHFITLHKMKNLLNLTKKCYFYTKSHQVKKPLTSSTSHVRIIDTNVKQNVFYFEESNLLPTDKLCSSYSRLYKEIPVVAVLGWAGAQDQQLQKYSQIYSSLGYHTIRFSPSHSLTFLMSDRHEKYAYNFLDLFKQQHNLTDNKILIHLFSNASFFIVYHHLIELTRVDFINKSSSHAVDKLYNEFEFFRKNHAGLIFDSSLGMPLKYLNMLKFWQSMSKNILKSVDSSKKSSPIISLLALISNLLFTILFDDSYYKESFEKFVKNDATNVPTLHLYSKADLLTTDFSISRLIEAKRQKCPHAYIKSVVYDDEKYDSLFLTKYSDDYIRLVKEHLEICQMKLPVVNKNRFV